MKQITPVTSVLTLTEIQGTPAAHTFATTCSAVRSTVHEYLSKSKSSVVIGPSLWRSLAPPTFVAGRDRPSGGAPRHFSPATLAPRL